jgi:Fe-S-cluster-containing hydrogenase component 2
LNGEPVALSDRGAARLEPVRLRRGKNVLAARVTPENKKKTHLAHGASVLSVWLGALPEVGQLTRDLVEDLSTADFKLQQRRAVVCDLCSSLPSGVPACVHDCPHEAAIRIDALTGFPQR